MPIFRNVSLLITHYNRSSSLQRLLNSFKEIDCVFDEIVVSDDGSKPEHLNQVKILQGEYGFKLIESAVNKGLGNNINKGQEAINSPYTLYVQEDFVPLPLFAEKLMAAYHIISSTIEIDVVRFYAYFKYPFTKPYKDGFDKMIFSQSPLYRGYKKFYYYSDHPHLRRSDFLNKFGKYAEHLNPEATEFKMMISFLQKKGKALIYKDIHALFTQINTSSEPSTLKRNYWRNSNNLFVKALRHVFRHLKFNGSLLISRLKNIK